MNVGSRIRLGRKAAGLSQREMAAMCNLSAMAISKYERDVMMPSSSVLLAIADTLGVSTEFLLSSTSVSLTVPLYRCKKSLRMKDQASVLAKAQAHIERYVELESLLSMETAFKMPTCSKRVVSSIDDVEKVSSELRHEWGLGKGPIENLMEVLESNGIKVAVVDAHAAFDALFVQIDGGAPVVVVRRDLVGDRQRFSVAHELGHLMVKHQEGLNAEKVANRFAGALLVPAEAAVAELGVRRSRLDVRELCSLKRKYGMSISAWAYRAKDLGIITNTYFSSFNRFLRMKGLHREEFCLLEQESTSRMARLVQRAIAEGLVSRTKAMELSDVAS